MAKLEFPLNEARDSFAAIPAKINNALKMELYDLDVTYTYIVIWFRICPDILNRRIFVISRKMYLTFFSFIN